MLRPCRNLCSIVWSIDAVSIDAASFDMESIPRSIDRCCRVNRYHNIDAASIDDVVWIDAVQINGYCSMDTASTDVEYRSMLYRSMVLVPQHWYIINRCYIAVSIAVVAIDAVAIDAVSINMIQHRSMLYRLIQHRSIYSIDRCCRYRLMLYWLMRIDATSIGCVNKYGIDRYLQHW